MPVEYYLHQAPNHSHELGALLNLARAMQQAFAPAESFYVLAANVQFWGVQADAVLLSAHAIVLLELKACLDPIRGDARTPWQTIPTGVTLHGGSHVNPYQQVTATREALMKYLDRNRRRFLGGTRATAAAHQWGQVSAAIAVSPFLHPASDIVLPPESRVWLRVIGLNEVVGFLFSRTSSQIDLLPLEMRRLAEALGCRQWTEIETLLPPVVSYGHVWLLDEAGRRTYAFPIVDAATLGRSRDCSLVVPRQFSRTSGHHAFLRLVGDVVWLHDDDSTNGTFVNGVRVTRTGCALEDDAQICLGDIDQAEACHLRFERRARTDHTADSTAITQA
jgi:hypothetical protein